MKIDKEEYLWRPLSLDYLISKYSLTHRNFLKVILVWLLFTVSLLFLAIYLQRTGLLNFTVDSINLINVVAFNPIYIFGILLMLWFGFEWGFIPVYLSTFAAVLLTGVSVFWSSVIALAFVLGLVFYALAYHSFRVPYSLNSLKSLTMFVVISFLASLASSLGSFTWSFLQQLSAQETLIYWKRWWTGTFFQSVLIAAPLLYLLTPTVEKLKEQFFDIPVQEKVSIGWIYGSVISIAATLAFFIYSGYQLGRFSLNDFIRNRDEASITEIVGAIEAFSIITWTSIGLIVVTAFAAFYLLNNWNRSLREEVAVRTEDLDKSREKLKASLKEKDILFKEIQHRVKNNLAQVHGLLELQETMSENTEMSELLKLSKSRIRTMSLAHEALYNSEDFSKISLRKYIERICDVTHVSFKDHNKELDLLCNLDDMSIKMARAIPLGLMVSEILINAHKHAFNGRKNGRIEIDSNINETHLQLNIKDNGVGIPKDLDIRKNNSLGMILIDNFTQQLKASLDITSNSGGTSFAFNIPLTSIHRD